MDVCRCVNLAGSNVDRGLLVGEGERRRGETRGEKRREEERRGEKKREEKRRAF